MKTLILGHSYCYKKMILDVVRLMLNYGMKPHLNVLILYVIKKLPILYMTFIVALIIDLKTKLNIMDIGSGNLRKIIHMILLLIVLEVYIGTDKNNTNIMMN